MNFGAFTVRLSRPFFCLYAVTLAIIFAGCAHQDLRPSGLTVILSTTEISNSRHPAASASKTSDGAVCFFDRFKNPDLIEIQNAETDSRAMPEKIRGQRDKIYDYFKGRISGFVHPKFQSSLESCTDPMCFYEKVYGRAVSGKLAYLLFLKTGMAVSASDAVPSVSSRPSETGAALADFLFTDAELTMLIESSESVTSPNFSLFVQPALRTLHKVPASRLATAENARVRNSCGFANGSFLVLQSDCLAGDWQAKLKRGDFGFRTNVNQGNDVFLHEFGHCVDYNLGGNGAYSSRSDWTSLSQPLRPAADGVIYYSGDAPPGFVTGYAATSYKEDFAETFSHFRLRPDDTKKTVSGKFDFLRKNVFKDQDFTVQGIRNEFANLINAKLLDRMNDILGQCIGRPDTGTQPVLYKTTNLAASEISCVEAEAFRIASEQFRIFQRAYPEGCLESGAQWTKSLLAANATNVSKAMGSLENVRRLAVARELMQAALDPNEAYLEFRQQSDAKRLYRQALERNFEKFRAKFEEIERDLASGELKNYLARYDFDLVRNSIQSLVLEQSKANAPKMMSLAESSFQGCVKSARVTTPSDLLKREFKPGSANEFIECGRKQWLGSLEPLMAEIFKRPSPAVSKRFLQFAVEVANLDMEDRFRQRTEEEVQKLEKQTLIAAAARLSPTALKPIPLAKILSTPVLEREDTCRGVVRKTLYDDVFRTSTLSAFVTYTQSLLAAENSYCEEFVDRNQKHRDELEAYRNQAARIVYSLAFKTWPKVFPQDSTTFATKDSPAEVVDPAKRASCFEDLSKAVPSEPRLSAMLKAPAQAKLVSSGVREVCINGRYAGRFNWMPSDRYISYGGVRALGFAQFYQTAPTGGENRTYLYALKRYIQLRTAERLEK
jgi:hypothetical protein